MTPVIERKLFFSETEIAEHLKSNEADLIQVQARNPRDTVMQAELYKQQGLVYLEAMLTQMQSIIMEPHKERGLLYLEAIKTHANDEKICLASTFFSQAIALDADDRTTAFCLSKRASLNVAQGNVGAGIEDFKTACKLVNNDSQIWFEYGKALVDLERFEEALVPLKQALILRPQNPGVHNLIETVISSGRVSENCLDDIRALTKVGRDLSKGPQRGNDMHLWLQVVQAGDKDFMSYLAPQVDTRMHDGMGNTALHYAARAGHAHLIAPLVKNCKLDPNAKNRDGLTPLMIALQSGNTERIQALVAVGAKYSGAKYSLVAFENFPFPKATVFPTEETKETKETKKTRRVKRATTSETEETTGLKRTTSFRIYRQD